MLLGTAALGLLVSAAPAAFAEEIVIGAATAQTGGLAPYDQPALAGLRMAVQELNAKGGLDGKYKINLVIKDTRSDTAQTATAAQELIDAGAKILITPCDADPSISAGQLTQPLGIPTLTLCGTAPVLT
jgi:branched-chain amino acid transport system substrate-binding protein